MRLDIQGESEAPDDQPKLGGQGRVRAPRLQVVEVADGAVVRRGRTSMMVRGEGAAQVVVRLLNTAGERGAEREDLYRVVPGRDLASVKALVDALLVRGLLTADDVEVSRTEDNYDVFLWQFGGEVAATRRDLGEASIAVLGVNCISRRLAGALADAGFRDVRVIDFPLLANLRLYHDDGSLDVSSWQSPEPIRSYESFAGEIAEGYRPDCLVVTSDFGGATLLREWNNFAVSQDLTLLPVVLGDLIGRVGPLVVPGETACLECFLARENSHLPDVDLKRRVDDAAFEGQAVNGFHPSMASILADIATLELSRFLGHFDAPRAVGTVLEVNLLDGQMKSRKVLRVPRCRVCSPVVRRSPAAVRVNTFMPGN